MGVVKTQETSKLTDYVLWLIVALIVGGGVYANDYYGAEPVALRIIAGIFIAAVALFVTAKTSTGRNFLGFAGDARMEMRKVVWPSRQEVVQMALLVMAMAIVMSILLWISDTFLMWAIGWLTGQRG